MVIVLNGTAASGKGTLARMLADALSLPHYDFGLIFRALASLRQAYDWSEITQLVTARSLQLVDGIRLFELDHTASLRSEAAGLVAARLIQTEEQELVRAAKLLVKHDNFVADGRTVSQIFPHADLHFHVVADQAVARARRMIDGDAPTLFDERWRLDNGRVKAVAQSVVIDTSERTPDDVLGELLRHVAKLTGPVSTNARRPMR